MCNTSFTSLKIPQLIDIPFVTDRSENTLQGAAFKNGLQHYKFPVN
jgi:hypothetical protein